MEALSCMISGQYPPGEGLLQALFDTEDAVFLCLMDNDGLPRSLACANDAACTLLGYTREGLYASPQRVLAKLRGSARAAQLSNKVTSRHQTRFQAELTTASGHQLAVEVTSLLLSDDRQSAAVFVCRSNEPAIRQRRLLRVIKRRRSEELKRERIRHRNNLENLVRERTIELKSAHEQLQRELIERLITNAALRESEEHLRTLINSIPDIICFKDGEGRWLEANQYTIDFLGLAGINYTGLTDKELAAVSPVCCSSFIGCANSDEATWSAASTCSFEEKMTSADGCIKIFEVLKVPLYYPGGARKGLLVVGGDITERQRAREMEKTIEAEKVRLERLNLVGEMAVNIGHEIRNPMTTVRGYLQLMHTKPEFHVYRTWLDLMIQDLDKANAIITNFISLAKNKALRLTCCDLNQIVASVAPDIMVQASAERKSISVTLGAIPSLMLDEKEIQQLIRNLAANGLDVSPPDEALEFKTYHTDEGVVLEIADKGPGFPEHLLDKLGTPFLSTKESGAGLGLAVCYHIAERHHARLQVITGATGTRVLVCFKMQ